jgi:hypothetical protein
LLPSEAQEILARARCRSDRREAVAAAQAPRDYKALNKMVQRQRAALKRAIKSGDAARVVIACRDAVREWDQPGSLWPDDWSLWQRALDDVLRFPHQVQLTDLAD